MDSNVLSSDSHGLYHRGPTGENCIKHSAQRQREISFEQLQGLPLRQDVNHRRILGDIERLPMTLDQSTHSVSYCMWRCSECRETDPFLVRIQDAQRTIVSRKQRERAFHYGRRDFSTL